MDRKDGMSQVFKWHLGAVAFKGECRKDSNVKVFIYRFSSENEDYCRDETMYNGKPNYSRLVSNICSFVPRITFIVDKIHELMTKDPLRKVLILSDRRNHLKGIREAIDAREGLESYKTGLYIGGMKQDALDETADTCDIILGTYSISAEGLDIPKLNTLVLASPKTDIEQSVGRILRSQVSQRMYDPVVIDILDGFNLFPSQLKKRKSFYTKSNYDVVTRR
jgi:hypothetical protein